MSTPLSFSARLRGVLIPTTTQALGAIFLALAILTLAQIGPILSRVGITPQAISASQDQFHARFDVILRSPVAANIALMTFWAVIGLVAYLICWGAYNALIQARNEVTLTTAYTNRGHWRGPYETLAIKAVSSLALALVLSSLWWGVSFWFVLAVQAVATPQIQTALLAALAVLGFAVQLYAIFATVQLTFTPWYRAEAFTNA